MPRTPKTPKQAKKLATKFIKQLRKQLRVLKIK